MSRPQSSVTVDVFRVAATLLCFTLLIAILYFAQVVLIPVALAVMVTFILSPLVTRLDRRGVHRIAAVLAVVLMAGLLATGLALLVTWQLHSLANDLPNYRENIKEKLALIREGGEGGVLEKIRSTFAVVAQEPEKPQDDNPSDSISGEPEPAAQREPWPVRVVPQSRPEETFYAMLASLAALSPAFGALATGGLSLILVIFMLIRRENLRNRLVSLTSEGSLTTMTKALDEAGRRISRYLLMQAIINGTFGLAVGAGLLIIGVPYALLWGLCAAVLRYIPYIGPWIAALLPISVSLITSPGWTQLLLVFALFFVLELISNNIMEPWLYGQGIGISEVALLVSAAFWTWIWGPVGLVLATPLTVCLAVSGKYVPALAFLDRLLGDRDTLRPHAALLQRLLAKDDEEAFNIVQQYCEEHGPESVYDHVLIPALSQARHDRDRGTMDADEDQFVLKATRRILERLDEEQLHLKKKAEAVGEVPKTGGQLKRKDTGYLRGWHLFNRKARDLKPRENSSGTAHLQSPGVNSQSGSEKPNATVPVLTIRVLGCAAHREVEELTLHMLGQLTAPAGVQLDVLSTRILPSEIVNRIKQERPAVMIIGALPPGGLIQAHYLCKLLRKRFPNLGIVVGLWNSTGNLDRSITKFRAAGAHYITTTLIGAREHIVALARAAEREKASAVSSATANSTTDEPTASLQPFERQPLESTEHTLIATTPKGDDIIHE